jgi:hypothetical protein
LAEEALAEPNPDTYRCCAWGTVSTGILARPGTWEISSWRFSEADT